MPRNRLNHFGGLLVLAGAALTVACASSGAVPQPFPRPSEPAPAAAPAEATAVPDRPATVSPDTRADGDTLSSTALSFRGAPYLNGGTTPGGFDCSGFVQYVFGQFGITMPRETREQFRIGRPVDRADLAPGDLVFFSTTTPGPSHVGIVTGDDRFVHAPSSKGVVRVERLSVDYWARRFIGARRPR